MAQLILLPSELEHRSEFYHQLGSMLPAGLTITKSLETLLTSPPSGSLKKPIQQLLESIQRGSTFVEGTARLHDWLPSFDLALLRAGEESGRLDACCTLLASYYHERAQRSREIMSDLAYPLFVLHFAIFIFPLPSLVLSGNFFVYASQTLGVLLPIYAVVFGGMLACRGKNGVRWRSLLEKTLGAVPILGLGRQNLALARFAASLEALLNAGVNMLDAWDLAAASSASPALEQEVRRFRPKIESGSLTPAEAIKDSPEFPEMFSSLYHTAELSGQIDATLKRLHTFYQDAGSRQIRNFCKLVPRVFYLVIACVIGMKVIGFWSNYFNEINKITQ